ncbi:MAG: dTMP kinase [Clostridia bacterium]|jgi:dTMP kinase|nr:dTMP kinase [Clostridia bacterium]
MRGKFVTFEGCEGVGKSTQLRLVKEDLARAGVDAVFTREPGGTAIAEKIRSLILDPDNVGMDAVTELLLYAAARRQHTMELIEPALAAGKTVFCDRYIDSTFAYQGFARGLDLDVVHALETIAMGDVQIDLTIFLDVDPSVGFARKGGADPNDRLERENAAFFQKVYEGFRRAAAENERIVAVSAPGTKYDTHETIMRLLRERGIV